MILGPHKEEILEWLREAADPECHSCDGGGIFFESLCICSCVNSDAEPCNPKVSEPSFRLLARDPQAPALLRRWADDRQRYEPESKKPQQARVIADAMEKWKRLHPGIGMPKPIEKMGVCECCRDATPQTILDMNEGLCPGCEKALLG